ncbi:interleukin-18 receptor accessory protein-like isoform X4 [Pungitius pungitius]|uniref:interleukin-18 receptor accessory protein-like isoform X4 n=1 Tax=Pungitius pungitius TaxID=134920 RepID=UPI002E114257
MRTICVLFSFIFPIFSEGCCGSWRDRKAAKRDDNQHYRAVEGEMFLMPCIESVSSCNNAKCSRTGEGAEGTSFDCGTKFSVEAKHAGKYTCSGSTFLFHLQVVKRSESSLGCFLSKESSVELVDSKGGTVPCPGHTCSNNTHVIWYKDKAAMSRQKRPFCLKSGGLYLCTVTEHDTGVYFCDRQIREQGVIWTFRRAVNVTVIRPTADNVTDPPKILYPNGNVTEKVELGLPHTLECVVHFLLERHFPRKVLWYMNYGGKTDNMTLVPMEEQKQQEKCEKFECKVIGRALIKQVTPQHLNQRFTCIASNNVSERSGTIQLKDIRGIVLQVKWLEIQLIYRSYFQHRKHDGDEKEFDVFLSCVWSPPSTEVGGVWTLSSQRGPNRDEEACLAGVDPLITREGVSTLGPLEVMLPQVLEDQWGYRLCLLERDVAPGGAFTNDVVLAIQRSRMLICLLSADYLSNSNAVFVLESGIQALLQNSSLKLLPIWTGKASASLAQPDTPLPTLVQRALKVLPSLDCTSGQPSTSCFWRSLRKNMPDQRAKLDSLMPNQKVSL